MPSKTAMQAEGVIEDTPTRAAKLRRRSRLAQEREEKRKRAIETHKLYSEKKEGENATNTTTGNQ